MNLLINANTDDFFYAYAFFAGEILENNKEIRDFFLTKPEDFVFEKEQDKEKTQIHWYIQNLEFVSRARNFYLT